MSTTFEPGTVAVATVRGVPNVRVMAGYGTAEPRLRWVTTDDRLVDAEDEGWWFSYQVTDVSPLVVLDLSGGRDLRYTVADLRDAAKRTRNTRLAEIADQIEGQTRPPKPAEPTGLGAVVEDADGERWVRRHSGSFLNPGNFPRDYADINAVRVLSPGVTS